MTALVFRLRNVPEDEAADVRALLDEAGIDWFETTAGNWGIAMPGLWVERDEDRARARALIERYQRERAERMRAEREARIAAGTEPGFLDRLRERPLAVTGVVAFCLFIVYVMVQPFVRLVELTHP